MTEQEITNKQIIDHYILDRLDTRQREAFEAHLLFCRSCRKQLADREAIVYALQQAAVKETSFSHQYKHPDGNGRYGRKTNRPMTDKTGNINRMADLITKYAAILLLGIGTGFLLWILWIGAVPNAADKSGRLGVFPDEMVSHENNGALSADLLAWAATREENPYLEDFMDNTKRSLYRVDITSPTNGRFFFQSKILFSGNLRLTQPTDLQIKIYDNNTNRYILDQPLDSLTLAGTYSNSFFTFETAYDSLLHEGLYYFTLETIDSDEPLYVGKFYRKNLELSDQ
jgi:hypothetical protein